MRIVIHDACARLQGEVDRLSAQRNLCQQWVQKINSISLDGMSGKAAEKMTQRIRSQSAIVASHYEVYRSVIRADNQNKALIAGLPTTSPGVMDTAVAQMKLNEAISQIARLKKLRNAAVRNAQNTNRQIAQLASQSTTPSAPVHYVDINAINMQYNAQISWQESQKKKYQNILDRAAEYQRRARSLYSGVGLGTLKKSTQSAISYVNNGSWGNTKWVDSMLTQASLNTSEKVKSPEDLIDAYDSEDRDLLTKIIQGDKNSADVVSFGTGGLSGGFLHREWGVGTYGGWEKSKDAKTNKKKKKLKRDKNGKVIWDDPENSLEAGIKVDGEFDVLKLEAKGKSDWGEGDAELSVGKVAGQGEFGGSLIKKGKLDPRLVAKIGVEATALGLEGSGQLGTSDTFNAHGGGNVKVGTASAYGGMEVSKKGVEVKYGAEAYAVSGELSGGFTLFGIKVDLSIGGAAGGAGVSGGGKLGPKSAGMKGSIGAGVGLSAGINVDWSGVGGWIGDVCKNVKKGRTGWSALFG